MKTSLISLGAILLLLSSSRICAQKLTEDGEEIVHTNWNQVQALLPDSLKIALIAINSYGFCFFPKLALHVDPFIKSFYSSVGANISDAHEFYTNPSILLQKELSYNQGEPRIPFKLHRIWHTPPESPTEMIDVQNNHNNTQIYLRNIEVLSQSGDQWEDIFWTNDKSLIPRTVTFLEKHGFKTRELKELKSYQKWEHIYDRYLYGDDSLMAPLSDISRVLILLEEGGLYLDNDMIMYEWSGHINYLFDFYGGTMTDMFRETLNNMAFAAKPGHPALTELSNSVYEALTAEEEDKPIWARECFEIIDETIMLSSGPHMLSRSFFVTKDFPDHQFYFTSLRAKTPVDITIKLKSGDQKKVNVRSYMQMQSKLGKTWVKGVETIVKIGWPELL